MYLPITKKLKMKMKLYGNKVTDFYDKETPKMDCNHPCLAVINSNSAF